MWLTKFKGLPLLILGLTLLPGCPEDDTPVDPTAPLAYQPTMVLAPSTLDFGAVRVGERGDGLLTISNEGEATLEIGGLSIADGEDVFSIPTGLALPLNIEAGEATTLTLSAIPTELDTQYGTLFVSSNDPGALDAFVTLQVLGVDLVTPTPGDTPTPGTTPTPGSGTPTPVGVTPTPGSGTPTPVGVTPTPGSDTPTPGGVTPTPGADTPTPTQEPDLDGDGFSPGAGDCDDSNPAAFPGNGEVCDGADNDCNGDIDDRPSDALTFYGDQDGDGYGDPVTEGSACAIPSGSVAQAGDCDDDNPAINPGADELCNSLDDNCNGAVDDDPIDQGTFYPDGDGDSFGGVGEPITACRAPEGYGPNTGDCDDNNDSIYPEAPEGCDDLDNDCDGAVDEEGQSTWYLDGDGDGYGVESDTLLDCGQPEGYASRPGDCDDTQSAVSPGADETCNGEDENCNGLIDEDFDEDEDTFTTCGGDCDDGNASINPDASERCDGIDQDCDGVVDNGFDIDNDGFTQCGSDETPRDCDDSNDAIYPGASEACNGDDDDCDTIVDEGVKLTFYRDVDGDGVGVDSPTREACEAPEGYASTTGDCNDLNDSVYPGATEFCDTLDNDCDLNVDEGVTTTYYLDADQDTFGADDTAQEACRPPSSRYVTRGGDCNDLDDDIYPTAQEICDSKDNECDGQVDEGFDGDSDGIIECQGDCDDDDPEVYTGAEELCDGKDNNCNSQVDEGYDADSDGATLCGNALYAPDCDDNDSQVRPGLPESCDGKDNECDGQIDEGFDEDGDSFTTCGGDCDDRDPDINPAAPDEPFDTIDSNCDGSDGGAAGAIYVYADAEPGGDGTRAAPFQGLIEGLAAAVEEGATYILVAEGTYLGPLSLNPDQQVLGGYSATFDARNPDEYLSEVEATVDPDGGLPGAINCAGIQDGESVFEGFTILANAGSGEGASAIGLYAEDCDDSLVIRQVDLIVGPGNAGDNGDVGDPGTPGQDGFEGRDAQTISSCSTLPLGAAGGSLTCRDVDISGGVGGGLDCPSQGSFQPDGGDAPGGGLGGFGAADGIISSELVNGCSSCYIDGNWGAAENGGDGYLGDDGGSGSGGSADNFAFIDGVFSSDIGASGDFGGPGTGGGGGGTGSGAESVSCGDSHAGGMGGGGGSGGCGGDAGAGGQGGGGSFGVVLTYSEEPEAFPLMVGNFISASDGGAGGRGGDGGLGGLGGLGAVGGSDQSGGAWCSGLGGTGGDGGDGGTGGGGGGGAGGPSFGIFVEGASASVTYAGANQISIGRGGRGGRGGFGGRGVYGEDGEDGASGRVVQ